MVVLGARKLREENGIWGQYLDFGVQGEDASTWGEDFGIILGDLG